MDEQKKDQDWAPVERVMERRSLENQLPTPMDLSSTPSNTLAPPGAAPSSPDGVIARFKANRIERKAALEYIGSWYSAQLEIAKHRMTEVARVKKTETTVIADQFIRGLEQKHLQYLMDLGLQNIGTRNEALVKLNDQTSEMLKHIQTKEWPAPLRDKTIADVLELHERFNREIMKELEGK